jgi:BON domain
MSHAGIRATVKNGVVRLTGAASSQQHRLFAATAARRVPGVRAVAETFPRNRNAARAPADNQVDEPTIRLASSFAALAGYFAAETLMSFTTFFTPLTFSASFAASAFAVSLETVPNSVTTPSVVST